MQHAVPQPSRAPRANVNTTCVHRSTGREKWGTLRIEWEGADEELRWYAHMVLLMSARVCQQCGAPGTRLAILMPTISLRLAWRVGARRWFASGPRRRR